MTLIADSAGVAAFCRRLARADYITVDTEFMREKTFWPKLCLIQLAGPNEAAAIDPLVPGIDLTPLLNLLARESVLKVFHGARQDIEIFFHMSGKVPRSLYDTQIAAMVCGFGDQVGYETLVTRLTGYRLDKSSRFTDWSLRPLTEKQLSYALGDVIYLRAAFERLRERIETAGRSAWLEEELAVLTDADTYRLDPALAWQRLKTRSSDRRFLATLKSVAAWREEEAMRRDVPRNRVLRDEAVFEIAAHPPQDSQALGRIRGISRGLNQAEALLEAVRRGQELPLEQAPQPRPKTELPRGLGPLVDLLKVLLKHRCEQNHVAQKLVATTTDLERIAADDEAQVPALSGWRRQLFGNDALRLKHGKIALAAGSGEVCLLPVNGALEAVASDREKHQDATIARGGTRRRRRRRRNRAEAQEAVPGAAPADAQAT
ncbi:MAG: ribonuclease D [Alphaproteobacteria bacterium]